MNTQFPGQVVHDICKETSTPIDCNIGRALDSAKRFAFDAIDFNNVMRLQPRDPKRLPVLLKALTTASIYLHLVQMCLGSRAGRCAGPTRWPSEEKIGRRPTPIRAVSLQT
jgi:hypothetical protein